MRKRFLYMFLVCVAFSAAFAGCGKGKQEEVKEREKKEPEQMTFALVTKSGGNRYNELEAEGFRLEIEASGAKCVVERPKSTTAREQVRIIEKLIEERVDSITVAANDADALDDVLEKAQEEGILITTVDSNVNPKHTSLFINQADDQVVAKMLLDSVLDISGGGGQWAILSSSSMAPNQTSWIEAMRELMEKEPYENLELMEVVYGDDEEQISRDQALALLQTYQDLKVICAPTTVGCKAAAWAITQQESPCKLTGLGLPSEMESYLKKDGPCPYIHIWDTKKIGQLTARAAMALMAEELKGIAGQVFDAGDLGKFTVTETAEGSPEIIGGSLLRISTENTGHWKDIL